MDLTIRTLVSLKLFSTFFPSFLSFPSSLCFHVFIFDAKFLLCSSGWHDLSLSQSSWFSWFSFPSSIGIKNMSYHICHKDIFMGFVGLEIQSEWAQGKQKKKVNKKEVAMEFCYKWPQRNDTICRGQRMERNTHIYILRWLVEYRWKIDDVGENRISLTNLYWSKFSIVSTCM